MVAIHQRRLHSGLWAAEIRSGINSIQLRRVVPTGVEDQSESMLDARMISVTPNPAEGSRLERTSCG